jgi:manganese transport protein
MENTFFDTIKVENKNRWKKLLSFLGPAYLVSVGYMDPGNWATDIAAGSRYGYSLLWVIILSNLTAILVQSHSARLGIVTGKDIAQFSRGYYFRWHNFVYWVLAEIAIAATDLAEILGMAIGLKLLFGLNMLIGVTLSLFDTLIIMYLVKRGMRSMEAVIIALISIIGISFSIELFLSKPQLPDILRGAIPHIPDSQALYIAIGIIGATVMPHNLYLHSSLVQTRKFARDNEGKSKAIKYNFIDTFVALNLALFVNAAILILAASTFHRTGHFEVEDIQNAHKMLAPLLGTIMAPLLFGIALIASGQSSTLTGTLTGQIVMEGYLNIRLSPWLRRLITRLLAVIPAFFTILIAGESKSGALLILSQVILSLQLGFVVVPLLHWVSSEKIMGEFRIRVHTRIISWIVIFVILVLNLKMVYDMISGWMESVVLSPFILYLILILIGGAFLLLVYTILEPYISRFQLREVTSPHGIAKDIVLSSPKPFMKIGIGLDFSSSDLKAINYALKLGSADTEYCLIHIVESAGARIMHAEASDNETAKDKNFLEHYAGQLEKMNVKATTYVGFGEAENSLPKAVKDLELELLVLSSHRQGFLHRFFKGTTINKVQVNVDIPVFIVK